MDKLYVMWAKDQYSPYEKCVHIQESFEAYHLLDSPQDTLNICKNIKSHNQDKNINYTQPREIKITTFFHYTYTYFLQLTLGKKPNLKVNKKTQTLKGERNLKLTVNPLRRSSL